MVLTTARDCKVLALFSFFFLSSSHCSWANVVQGNIFVILMVMEGKIKEGLQGGDAKSRLESNLLRPFIFQM